MAQNDSFCCATWSEGSNNFDREKTSFLFLKMPMVQSFQILEWETFCNVPAMIGGIVSLVCT